MLWTWHQLPELLVGKPKTGTNGLDRDPEHHIRMNKFKIQKCVEIQFFAAFQ